jgi:UTP--glucose-1-phosphate uridylyltransferase
MSLAGLPEVSIRGFLRSLRFVFEGGQTSIHESEIEPVNSIAEIPEDSRFEEIGRVALGATTVIKLNGGLGTSMGLTHAKSLVPVRSGYSFLDLIAKQVLWQRREWNVELPLVFMNSYRTRSGTLAALERHALRVGAIPLDFLQNRVPRVDPSTGRQVEWSDDPVLEWCPPGHGDLYTALSSSGTLDQLRGNGIRYAFVSNADNLGAILDLRILGWFAKSGRPFMMEVADRTLADKKGGHLARRNGRLTLRERAQCPADELGSFEDIERHAYFNTNNLWLDLDALAAQLEASPDGLPLPVIRNERPIAPNDPDGPSCVQLETAMGAAIECFESAIAMRVPRERFAPVKTTNDLLALWSDAFELTEDSRLIPTDSEANRHRVIELDPRFYRHLSDLELRFPRGAPLLSGCRRLTIKGDHRFGAQVRVVGDVQLINDSPVPVEIPDGSVLRGEG